MIEKSINPAKREWGGKYGCGFGNICAIAHVVPILSQMRHTYEVNPHLS